MADIASPDTSSYPRLNLTPPPNPFGSIMSNPVGAIEGLANAQNAMNQNQLFQQTFRARQALGPIYQSAIDPQTGNFDINKFIAGVSTNPDTAFMAGDVINQAVQRQLTDAQTLNQHLEAVQKQTNLMASTTDGLLSKLTPLNPNVDPKDVVDSVSRLAAMGLIPKDSALAFIQNMPSDPTQLTSLLRTVNQTSKSAVDTLASVRGTPMAINTGGGQQIVMPQTGGTGQPTVAGSLTNTPTPEQKSALVSGTNAAGQPTLQPRMQVAPMYNGNGTVSSTPQGQTPGQTGPVTMGPPAQAAEYLQGKGIIAEKYEPALNESVDSSKLMLQTLHEQYNTLFNSDGTPRGPVGPGSAAYTAIANMVQAAGGSQSTADAIAGGDRAARTEFMKLAIGNAFGQLHQYLSGTTGRLTGAEWEHTLEEGTPNPDMLPQAIRGMMSFMDTLAKQKVSEQAYFQDFIQKGQQNGWKQGTPNAWPSIWSRIMQRSGMINGLDAKAKELAKYYIPPASGQ